MPHEGGHRRNFENTFLTGASDGNFGAYSITADHSASIDGRRATAADWRGYAADDGTHAAATAARRSAVMIARG